MLKKKINLLCYKKTNLYSNMILLPGFLGSCLYVYSGNKYNLLVISSIFMCFLPISVFLNFKKIGPIHSRKKNKRSVKKK